MDRRSFLSVGAAALSGCTFGRGNSEQDRVVSIKRGQCNSRPPHIDGRCYTNLDNNLLAADFDVRTASDCSGMVEISLQNTSDSQMEYGPSHWELLVEVGSKWRTVARGRAYDLLTRLDPGSEFLWNVSVDIRETFPESNSEPKYLTSVNYMRDHHVAVLDDVATVLGSHVFVVRELSTDPSAVVYPFKIGVVAQTPG